MTTTFVSPRRFLIGIAAVGTLLVAARSLSFAWPGDMASGVAESNWAAADAQGQSRIEYTTIGGIFLQSEASTDPTEFDYATSDFGLIERAYPPDSDTPDGTQWERFARYVDTLNKEALSSDKSSNAHTRYAVLFMGRHGEGDHNVAEALYGTPAWNCYWAQLDGNGTAVWADAHLTRTGEAEATRAHRFWADQLAVQKQPAPQRYYASPLTRCLQTASITFAGLALPVTAPFRPTIKEFLREDVSTHTCDRRASRAALHAAFPAFAFEDDFAETDPLWTGTTDETPTANDVRSKALLDDIFHHDDSTWISFTSHSGEITSLLRVLGHRPFALSTGQIIPVLVRVTTVHDDVPAPPATTTWTKGNVCPGPPITSVPDQGCMCEPTGQTSTRTG